jgi:hypothetical protein
MTVFVRESERESCVKLVTAALRELEPTLMVSNVRRMESGLAWNLARERIRSRSVRGGAPSERIAIASAMSGDESPVTDRVGSRERDGVIERHDLVSRVFAGPGRAGNQGEPFEMSEKGGRKIFCRRDLQSRSGECCDPRVR